MPMATLPRGVRHRARVARHELVFADHGGSHHDAVTRIGGEAPRGGPILNRGAKAIVQRRVAAASIRRLQLERRHAGATPTLGGELTHWRRLPRSETQPRAAWSSADRQLVCRLSTSFCGEVYFILAELRFLASSPSQTPAVAASDETTEHRPPPRSSAVRDPKIPIATLAKRSLPQRGFPLGGFRAPASMHAPPSQRAGARNLHLSGP